MLTNRILFYWNHEGKGQTHHTWIIFHNLRICLDLMFENLDFWWHCSKCKQMDALSRRTLAESDTSSLILPQTQQKLGRARRLRLCWLMKKKEVWPTCLTWLTSLTWTSLQDVSDDPRQTTEESRPSQLEETGNSSNFMNYWWHHQWHHRLMKTVLLLL